MMMMLSLFLAKQPGRLDEVFRNLTRSDTADMPGKNAS